MFALDEAVFFDCGCCMLYSSSLTFFRTEPISWTIPQLYEKHKQIRIDELMGTTSPIVSFYLFGLSYNSPLYQEIMCNTIPFFLFTLVIVLPLIG
jgi:hypothetical protein